MENKSTNKKISREKEIVSLMIDLYHKGGENTLTMEEYLDIKEYSMERLDSCPFGEDKTFCSSCQVHCYDGDHREKIRLVMRHSAPRMLFYHPVMMLRHTLASLKRS